MARNTPEINAGSMADIAFLLLIFFLVTTTMDVDSGIIRKLPPPPDKDIIPPKIQERNVFVVLINRDNNLAIEAVPAQVDEICEKTKDFFLNPSNNENLAYQEPISDKINNAVTEEKPEEAAKWRKIQAEFGDITISKGVVSLQNDRATKYEKYLIVQNEIVRAFNEMRDAKSKEKYGKKFDELTEAEQDFIKEIIPLNISEAEPRSIGTNK